MNLILTYMLNNPLPSLHAYFPHLLQAVIVPKQSAANRKPLRLCLGANRKILVYQASLLLSTGCPFRQDMCNKVRQSASQGVYLFSTHAGRDAGLRRNRWVLDAGKPRSGNFLCCECECESIFRGAVTRDVCHYTVFVRIDQA